MKWDAAGALADAPKELKGDRLSIQTCKPSREREGSKIKKFPKVLRRGCKRSFGPSERRASCTGATWGCKGAKEVSEGARDSWETLASWVQKTFCILS